MNAEKNTRASDAFSVRCHTLVCGLLPRLGFYGLSGQADLPRLRWLPQLGHLDGASGKLGKKLPKLGGLVKEGKQPTTV